MNKNPANELFERIKLEGKDFLTDAIETKAVENYYLDFKVTQLDDYSGKRKLLDSDKKNYAKAISAFGNSEGGVLVWGIATGSADADYAEKLAPIKSVKNFQSLLEGFTSQLTTPAHTGTENIIIYEDESEDLGYVITHIPKAINRPIQVINQNEFRYFIRAGSSSHPAPDNYLRSLFGRDPQPDCFIMWGAGPTKLLDDGTIHAQVGLVIINTGENVAQNLNGYAHIGGRDMAIEVNKNTANLFSYNQNAITGMKIGFMAKTDFILGVEQEVQPLFIHFNIKKPITENGIQVHALITADNQPSYRIVREIGAKELDAAYDKYIEDNSYDIIGEILREDI